jgi:ATP phosphoribosyltransferase
MFTHVIPAGPFLMSPEEDSVANPNNIVVMWEPVTQTIDGSTDIGIIGYQVIVETEDPGRLANVRVFNTDVGASVTSVTVPPEFLDPDTEYDFEVLATEVSGNQTLLSSSFTTAP